MQLKYKGWTMFFDDPPSSQDLEDRYEARVTASEVHYPVATPTPIERVTGPRTLQPLLDRRVAFVTKELTDASRAVVANLAKLGGTLVAQAEHLAEVGAIAADNGHVGDVQALDWEKEESLYAVICDATSFTEPPDLDRLRQTYRPAVMSMKSSGRCMVIGGRPEDAKTALQAATWYALDGFIRSLSGEMGAMGATSNIIRVAPGGESNLLGPMRFLLSPRAAYVTGQTLRVTADANPNAEIDPNADKPLTGKTAIVTGAGGGMGTLTAKLLHAEGADIICVDLPGTKSLARVADKVNGSIVEVDLTTPDGPEKVVEAARAAGGVDIMAHLAGTLGDKMMVNMDADTWRRPVMVNLDAPIRITERLLEEGLINQAGRVLCVSSVSGIAGGPTMTAYAPSKSGVHGFVHYLTPKLAEIGVTMNAVAPGFTLTAFNKFMPQWMKNMFYRLNDLSQPGLPDDIANALGFLSLPESQGVTGHVIRVCGGSILGQ